jgi:branched-subunit amino acid aminotransferase/4-amino-4-deoxychorismate lyase
MKPRAFVVSKDAAYSSCAYTVIPVIDKQLLDLPYHIRRVKQSFALLNGDTDSFKYCDDLLAETCLKSVLSSDAKDGLLTICVGLQKSSENDQSNNIDAFTADSLFYEMPSSFLSVSSDTLIVDLQQYTRGTDPRIKGGSWPTERYPLENKRHKEASETIMYSISQSTSSVIESSVDNVKKLNDVTMLLTEGDLKQEDTLNCLTFWTPSS